MTPERWARVERLFHEAFTRGADEREAFLADACAGDDASRREIESLLAHDGGAAFLSTPAVANGIGGGIRISQALGPYVISAKIGAGGMGEVYKARDMRLNRTVALKALPAHLKDNADLRQRFEREAQAVAALNHPHICTLHDIGHHEGVDFLVMEYLEGETLADRLARKAGSKDPALPRQEVLRYAIEIAEALDHAHRKGITHRDLKPSNIMVTAAGAKVLDFGLAKVLARPVVQGFSPATRSAALTEEASLTAEGTILGTLQYMAPEQLEGKEADARTDIFAFGAIVYEMATGRKAFEGTSQASLIAAILDHDPPALSTRQPLFPSALDHIVKTCLAKNPDERRQTMHDVLLELTWIAAGDARAEAAAPVTAARERLRARIALVGIGLAAGSVVAGVAVWNITRASGPEPKPVVHLAIPLAPDAPLDIRVNRPSLALSPDGSRLVYTADRAGRRQLYVRPLDQREATPIPGTEGALSPFFSPDGQWVGFSTDGKLKKVPLAGGAPLTICDCDTSYGSWGPDDTVIFSSDRGLTQVSAATGARRTVTTLDPKQHEAGHLYPDILPGGQAVLFSVWTGGAWDDASIAVHRLETGERRILGEKGTNARYAPSGHLLFARAGSLMAAPFDLSRLAVTGPAVPLVEGLIIHAPTGAAQFALSRDGRLVYATPAAGSAERTLVWVDRRGGVQPLTATRKAFALPRLSPDGQRVALLTEDNINNSDIWMYEIARGTFTRLTFENKDLRPIWTPDGKRVTFTSTRAGPLNLFWIPADGTGPAERLLQSEYAHFPTSWSPDGQHLAFVEIHPANWWDIWILPLAGERKPRPFLRTPFGEGWPEFSPDGRWLAYSSNESGRWEAYVQPFPGPGGKVQISTEGGAEVMWAPNGRELFYRDDDKMMAAAVTLAPTFTVGKPQVLFEGSYEMGIVPGWTNYDVARDGRRFLMVKSERPSAPTRLEVVLDWTEELKRLVPTK